MESLLDIAQQFMGSHQDAAAKASQQNPDDAQLYQQASQHIANHPEQHQAPTDEEAQAAKDAHHEIYHKGNTSNMESMGSDAVGGAVATQAIQAFMNSGQSGDVMQMVMTEASSLLGGSSNSDFKSQVMQKAAMMVFKSQMGGGGGGMMSMLQKFM
ncbi:hypothetical protein B0H11DRAFT_380401 [Mycena galericulata]|nr:hypothetical protein B0H11DRAFT_380401 [Mycena galericulata]